MFDELLRELLFFESGEPRYPETDRVWLSVSSLDLSHTIWIPFVPLSEMTVERVLESVEPGSGFWEMPWWWSLFTPRYRTEVAVTLGRGGGF